MGTQTSTATIGTAQVTQSKLVSLKQRPSAFLNIGVMPIRGITNKSGGKFCSQYQKVGYPSGLRFAQSNTRRLNNVTMSATSNESSQNGGNPLGASEKLIFQVPTNIGQKQMSEETYSKYIGQIKEEQSKVQLPKNYLPKMPAVQYVQDSPYLKFLGA